MLSPKFSIIIAIFVFTMSGYAGQADLPPTPVDSKGKIEPGTSQAVKQTPPTAGVTVFVDGVTGKIRQPNSAEIETLATTPAVSDRPENKSIRYGLGGAIGMKLGADSRNFVTVTKTADGKLSLDCLTGDTAATAKVDAPASKETR